MSETTEKNFDDWTDEDFDRFHKQQHYLAEKHRPWLSYISAFFRKYRADRRLWTEIVGYTLEFYFQEPHGPARYVLDAVRGELEVVRQGEVVERCTCRADERNPAPAARHVLRVIADLEEWGEVDFDYDNG